MNRCEGGDKIPTLLQLTNRTAFNYINSNAVVCKNTSACSLPVKCGFLASQNVLIFRRNKNLEETDKIIAILFVLLSSVLNF